MTSLFNKVFLGVIFFLVLFYTFWLGYDVKAGDGKEVVADAVLLVFWLFGLAFFSYAYKQEKKFDAEFAKNKQDLDNSLGKLIEKLKKEADDSVARKKQFVAIFDEVTGKSFFKTKSVSARHIAQIQKRWLDATGEYVNIQNNANGEISVELDAKKPVVKKTASVKNAPVKATARKVAAVKVPVVPAKKVTTKKGK